MRRAIRTLHEYIGLALSLVFFVYAVTGGALVYKEAYWRMVYPELRIEPPQLGPDDHAAAIQAAVREFGAEVGSVKFPEPGVPAYHLYLEGGEAFLATDDFRVIDRWAPSDRVMSWLFDLHAHLMAGETGERVGGVISLFGVLLAITGLVLWWPTRRRFSLRTLAPHGVKRHELIAWHRDIGVVATPILLVLLLSGSALVFYEAAGTVLNGIFGAPIAAPADLPAASNGSGQRLPDTEMMARVQATLPEGRIVFYYPPAGAIGHHEFRVKQPCELHPNGRSYVYLGFDGTVLGSIDACEQPAGERTLHAMYPLHAGKADSSLYKFATLLGAVALAILSLSGAVAYFQKLRRKEAAPTRGAARPKVRA